MMIAKAIDAEEIAKLLAADPPRIAILNLDCLRPMLASANATFERDPLLGLAQVISILERSLSGVVDDVRVPLLKLLTAFEVLRSGHVDPLLSPAKLTGPPPDPRRWMVRACLSLATVAAKRSDPTVSYEEHGKHVLRDAKDTAVVYDRGHANAAHAKPWKRLAEDVRNFRNRRAGPQKPSLKSAHFKGSSEHQDFWNEHYPLLEQQDPKTENGKAQLVQARALFIGFAAVAFKAM